MIVLRASAMISELERLAPEMGAAAGRHDKTWPTWNSFVWDGMPLPSAPTWPLSGRYGENGTGGSPWIRLNRRREVKRTLCNLEAKDSQVKPRRVINESSHDCSHAATTPGDGARLKNLGGGNQRRAVSESPNAH